MKWLKRTTHDHGLAVLTAFCPGSAVALRLEQAGSKFRVASFVLHEVPVATADVLGRLADEAGLRKSPLIALLPPDSYQVLMLESPTVPEDELRSAVRWKLKDMLDYHIDDAVFDLLKVPGGGGARLSYLYAVTVPAQAVRELIALYRASGLGLEVIDVDETAQRHIAARLEPPGYAVGLLHVHGERGLLTFTFEGELVLARRIDLRGVPQDEVAERVVLEVQRSVDYFDRQFHALPMSRLYLAPMADGEELYRQLHENLSLPVERLDLGLIFDFNSHADLQRPATQAQVFHALGAAMREWAGS
ncbi:MSHA biogenesis protein MshI [Sulfuritortus calidifontis]|uniref:MSHA biogenesis protein MshI n=1 Tax=Sulfuritortus calidifontis TaxID=1914471 RepID=A0A4V2UQP4_9PROT|nr:agglutinin biogenesis protein MshI [Sulfuritortus calidifontis]TCS71892.1 MSHA biogenesis protein MshI [Sulfuritortus calidifontis]